MDSPRVFCAGMGRRARICAGNWRVLTALECHARSASWRTPIPVLCVAVMMLAAGLSSPVHAAEGADVANDSCEIQWVIAVHGGAGNIARDISEQRQAAYHAALARAVAAGSEVLAEGGRAVDAVEEAVRMLEDEPLFNAGRGAIMNIEGEHELDASIMCGHTLNAGGVAGIRSVANPVSVARAVMDDTRHVLLGGPGADQFAAERQFDSVSQQYFFTERRFEAVQDRREQDGLPPLEHPLEKHSEGTVGAVALDQDGHLAAATSTGGLTGKKVGRIGDSPITGAGNYADATVAVSGTGRGEEYIRHSAAAQVSWRMRYLGESHQEAVAYLLHEVFEPGTGGFIAVDANGSVVMETTTGSLTRGFADSTGRVETKIWDD